VTWRRAHYIRASLRCHVAAHTSSPAWPSLPPIRVGRGRLPGQRYLGGLIRDRDELRLHPEVCSGRMRLKQAQHEHADDVGPAARTAALWHPPSKRISLAIPRPSVCYPPAPMPDLLGALDPTSWRSSRPRTPPTNLPQVLPSQVHRPEDAAAPGVWERGFAGTAGRNGRRQVYRTREVALVRAALNLAGRGGALRESCAPTG